MGSCTGPWALRTHGLLISMVLAWLAHFVAGNLRGIKYKDYRGHQLLRVFVANEFERAGLIAELQGAAGNADWDVWEDHVDASDIRLEPAALPALESIIKRRRLNSKTLMSDVFNHCDGHVRDASAKNLLPEWDDVADGFFEDYRVLADQYKFMRRMANEHPMHMKLAPIGKSTEDRDILALQMSADIDQFGSGRPHILVAGGVHCREWVAHTTTLYVAHALLGDMALLKEYDWTFVPNLNPDGYKYTWEVDRFWRKTRSRVSDCKGGRQFSIDPLSSPVHSNAGADANRNWGYHWKDSSSHGYVDMMGEPCSNVFAGLNAFSEPEPRALARYMKRHPEIIAYIDYHSYAQALLPPWGYKTEMPMDSPAQAVLCQKMIAGAKKINRHREYRWGANIFPADPGTSPDFAYGEEGIVATMTVELPDTGTHGFCLPRGEIIPVGKEQWGMIKAMAAEISQHPDGFRRRSGGGDGDGNNYSAQQLE